MELKDAFRVNLNSLIPLYHQIKENIRQLIDDEELSPGDALPSERELAETYGVSRLTVRQAIVELTRDGLLRRQQGVGTFVAPPKLTQAIPNVMGFTQRILQAGHTPSSEIINIEVQPATRSTARRLKLKIQAPVTKITRLRLVDREPVMLETSYLPGDQFPGLGERDLVKRSLYEVLASDYGVELTEAEETVEPIALSAYEAELLKAQEGTLALLVEVIAYRAGGRPVEFGKSIVRGDKSRYYFRITTRNGTQTLAIDAK